MTVSYYNTPWTTIYQYEYPENWQEIKHGFGYWKDPIKYIGEVGLCYIYNGKKWRKYDPKKPWKRW